MDQILYEHFRDFSSKVYLREAENNNSGLHCHRNMEIVYLVEGEMIGTINGTECFYTADDLILIPSFYSHSFRTETKSKVIIFIIPYENTYDFDSFFKQNVFDHPLIDKDYNKKIVLPLLRFLMPRRDPPFTTNDYVVKGISVAIVGAIINHYPPTTKKNQNMNTITSVLDYIDKNYAKDLSLTKLAELFNYNKDHFSKQFNKLVGQSLSTYINYVRAERVVNMLVQNNFDDKLRIIYNCGFNSPSTFYRAFHARYNKSLKDFFMKLKQEEETNPAE